MYIYIVIDMFVINVCYNFDVEMRLLSINTVEVMFNRALIMRFFFVMIVVLTMKTFP